MKIRAIGWAIRLAVLTMPMAGLPGIASAQSATDFALEYCYGQDCKSSKGEAILAMEAANPAGYAGKYVEIDSEVSLSDLRPLSFTFNVNPEAPVSVGTSVYGMSGANPAPHYCSASGAEIFPYSCSSEGALVQGFIDKETAVYGGHARNEVQPRDGHVPTFMSVHYPPPGSSPQLGVYLQSWEVTSRRPGALVWKVKENGEPAGYSSTLYVDKHTPFTCAADFYPKAGANPVYKPNTYNPTAPGKECQPRIVDQLITTRVVQTTCQDTIGNPCTPATGDKSHQETDFEFAGRAFGRAYHSLGQVEQRRTLAPNWVHSYSDRIFGKPGYLGKALHHFSDRGEIDVFVRQGNTSRFVSETSANVVLDVEAGNTYKLTSDGGTIRRFNAAGRLVSIASSDSHWRIEFAYDGDRLTTATDHAGRQLRFEYLDGRLSTLRLPDGTAVAYGYDLSGNLHSVQQPDGRTRTYHYNETGLSGANDRHALTGISDDGVRYATYAYDARNRARLSQHHANGQVVDKVELVYGSNGVVDVTDSHGGTHAYTTANAGGYRRVSSVAHAGNSILTTYTGSLPLQTTDESGSVTRREYTNGYESARHEAYGTSHERKTATVRDNANRIISRTVSDRTGSTYTVRQKTTYAYNVRGQVTARCEVDTVDATALAYACDSTAPTPAGVRKTVSSYCEATDVAEGSCPTVGLLTAVDGPRTDVADVTRYTYYGADAADCGAATSACTYRKGDLQRVTNARGHTADYLAYDGAGRPSVQMNANGVVSEFEYDERGRLTAHKTLGSDITSELDDRVQRIEYWPVGLIKKITRPDGTFTSYTYDSAQRLVRVADNAGNAIEYTLDAAGNRLREDTRGVTGELRHTLSRTYDTLDRLRSQRDAEGYATTFDYDVAQRIDIVTDALTRATYNYYDPLDRLVRTVRDRHGLASEATLEYDVLDRLIAVTDPKGLRTSYDYNAFGDLVEIDSPDTGATTSIHDEAGNTTRRVDANGIVVNYQYDALNRLRVVDYAAAVADESFGYDFAMADCPTGENFNVGRLGRMTDESGFTSYCYNRFGDLVRKVQRTAGKTLTLRWQYLPNGRLQKTIYPGNVEVDYQYDATGRVAEIGVNHGSGRTVLLAGATYHPLGAAASWTYGNGRVVTRDVDLNYRPARIRSDGAFDYAYEYDAAGQLDALKIGGTQTVLRRYAYDGLSRLTRETAEDATVPLREYRYDKTGNRTGTTELVATGGAPGPGGGTTYQPVSLQYAYAAGSHRLVDDGIDPREYDTAGNLTKIGSDSAPGGARKKFTYNADNRLETVSDQAVLATYRYNASGQRVRRTAYGIDTLSLYDATGNWVGDYNGSGAAEQQVIWFGGLPVGLVVGNGAAAKLYYVVADGLGTPRAVVDPVRDVAVWRWNPANDAFGKEFPNEDEDADGVVFSFDMRFPGQRFDAVSGLNYNYFREYEAGTGRYSQSDPIGLDGGISTYAYAQSSPLIYGDYYGLSTSCSNPQNLAACAAAGVRGTRAADAAADAAAAAAAAAALAQTQSKKKKDDCCTEYRNVFEPNKKHRKNRYIGPKGDTVARAPTNGPAALINSVSVGGNSKTRVGYDAFNDELVVLPEHRSDDVNCIKYFHGWVVDYNLDLLGRDAVYNAARKAGFPFPW